MQCLVELIFFFALIPDYYSVSLACLVAHVIWTVKRVHPCFICLAITYLIMVLTVMTPIEQVPSDVDWINRYNLRGLFDALRMAPESIELNLLLRLKYDVGSPLWRSEVTNSPVWSPTETSLNFLQSLLHFILTPQYGPIERV